MKADSKHIDSLIIRYLAHEASQEEIRQLVAWMDASEANKKYYDGIRFAHDKAIASRPIIAFDANKAWDKLHMKMHNPTVESKAVTPAIPLFQQQWFRVAASVLIILSISLTFYLNHSRLSSPEMISVEANEQSIKSQLADNSTIDIKKNSKIEYSKDFGKSNRNVILEGEAFFDVKHDTSIPFVVKTQNTFIKDIGTSFNIKSYPDSSFIEVFVTSGKVLFYSQNNPGVSLYPGESAIFDKASNTFRKTRTNDTLGFISSGRAFIFVKSRLIDVISKINVQYQQHILLKNPKLFDLQISVSFDNESIEKIASIISETLGLRVDRAPNGDIVIDN